MGQTTEISWTESTWNPLVGCAMVSPGCAHCYAETLSKRIAGMARADVTAGKNPGRKAHYLDVVNDAGRWNGKVKLVPEALADPLKWKRPRKVFVNSMSDLFHADVPFEYVDRVFAVMALTPQHTYQILTKRPERMAAYFEFKPPEFRQTELLVGKRAFEIADPAGIDWDCYWRKRDFGNPNEPPRWPLKNVWLGTSIEDQKRADERIPHLRRCPSAVHFLSVEPLLGPINFADRPGRNRGKALDNIQWCIVGGESGPGARPCDVGWVRSIVRQCAAAEVKCFVKQLGAYPLMNYYDDFREEFEGGGYEWPDALDWYYRDGQPPFGSMVRLPLNDAKGADESEWPADMRVRQFPAPVAAAAPREE